jgi:16S rRNA (adenine1518-N6/adenine1519-N6)-dimethyltransferase
MAAKRSLGQNFLIDRRAVQRIVAALAPLSGEPVLEIGPGRGALTGDLIRAAGRIAAVEYDDALAERLRERFAATALDLRVQDVLQVDLAEVASALAADGAAPLVVVGNLPYNISKPIAQMLIRQRRHVDRAVLMFQREVARRLTARPGSRAYGPLSVLAGFAFRIERLFDLPPRAFWPRPGVVSTVTRWTRSEGPALAEGDEQRLRRVLAACFSRRRKTLRNNLRGIFGDDTRVDRLLEAASLDGGLRAEAVPPEGFSRLAARWDDTSLL